MYIYIYIYTVIAIISYKYYSLLSLFVALSNNFPEETAKTKKRLQENMSISRVLLSLVCIIALSSRSLIFGLESLPGNLGIRTTQNASSHLLVASVNCTLHV